MEMFNYCLRSPRSVLLRLRSEIIDECEKVMVGFDIKEGFKFSVVFPLYGSDNIEVASAIALFKTVD